MTKNLNDDELDKVSGGADILDRADGTNIGSGDPTTVDADIAKDGNIGPGTSTSGGGPGMAGDLAPNEIPD